MKSLILASVVFMGIASTAMAAPENAPAPVAASEFLCNLSETPAPKLPGSNPAPEEKVVRVCGACSQDNCVGKNTGSACHNQVTGWAWCLNIYADNYCTDGKPMCYCTTGYP